MMGWKQTDFRDISQVRVFLLQSLRVNQRQIAAPAPPQQVRSQERLFCVPGEHAKQWDEMLRKGVGVSATDRFRLPPAFEWLSENKWCTEQPPIDQSMMPRPHQEVASKAMKGRHRQGPDRWGSNKCAWNKDHLIECSLPCEENTQLTRQQHSQFLLKYHPRRQWGVHAVRSYKAGEHVEEYVGDVIAAEEGVRRQSAKGPNDPSYLHRLTDDLYIDA